MKALKIFIILIGLSQIYAQQKGTNTAEYHPPLTIQECSNTGCQPQQKSIVLDGNWRWTHQVNSYTNCYTGSSWDKNICPDVATCTQNCALDGVNQQEDGSTYSISTQDAEISLGFVTQGQYSKNIGSRTYLLDDSENYKKFNLLNKEFTFDADVSTLPCGLNGALYFVEMDADGGKSKYATNKVGAAYGTGYCDAQCPHDIKFINGQANIIDWSPSATDPNSGVGKYGTCCAEMDIWEANSESTQITPHSCDIQGQTRCEGTDCGDNSKGDRYNGHCDKDGCDFNPYRLGNQNYYGPGSQYTIDTTKKFTVVTQFISDDGTDSGNLVEIKRFYVQDGNTIENAMSSLDGLSKFNSIKQEHCTEQKKRFNETDSFGKKGGLTNMGESFKRGMVLVMSLWDDHDVNMLWLDSNYPKDQDPSIPGTERGRCSTSSGVPSDVEKNHPNAKISWSNIKFGAINSTFTPPSTYCNNKQDGYYCDESDSTLYHSCPGDKKYTCAPPGTTCKKYDETKIQCSFDKENEFLSLN